MWNLISSKPSCGSNLQEYYYWVFFTTSNRKTQIYSPNRDRDKKLPSWVVIHFIYRTPSAASRLLINSELKPARAKGKHAKKYRSDLVVYPIYSYHIRIYLPFFLCLRVNRRTDEKKQKNQNKKCEKIWYKAHRASSLPFIHIFKARRQFPISHKLNVHKWIFWIF